MLGQLGLTRWLARNLLRVRGRTPHCVLDSKKLLRVCLAATADEDLARLIVPPVDLLLATDRAGTDGGGHGPIIAP